MCLAVHVVVQYVVIYIAVAAQFYSLFDDAPRRTFYPWASNEHFIRIINCTMFQNQTCASEGQSENIFKFQVPSICFKHANLNSFSLTEDKVNLSNFAVQILELYKMNFS